MLCSVTESAGNSDSTPGPPPCCPSCWPCPWRLKCSPPSRPGRSCAMAAVAAATSASAISKRRSSYIAGSRIAAHGAPSFELDVALDLDRQADAPDGQDHLRRQSFVSFEPAIGDGFTHRLLD